MAPNLRSSIAMSRRSWIMFGLLAAFWGASYLFIKVALEDGMAPAGHRVRAHAPWRRSCCSRVAAHIGALRACASGSGRSLVLALVQVAVPFMLITVGEQEISSSLTGILVATAPIFTFLLAFAPRGRGARRARCQPGWAWRSASAAWRCCWAWTRRAAAAALVGGLLVVLASLGYGLGAWFLKRRLPGVQPVGRGRPPRWRPAR